MEAVKFVSVWVNWLFVLIPPVTILAVIYYAIGMMFGEDKYEENKSKIITTTKAAVVIWTINGLILLIKTFY
jgi:hypothetical protein